MNPNNESLMERVGLCSIHPCSLGSLHVTTGRGRTCHKKTRAPRDPAAGILEMINYGYFSQEKNGVPGPLPVIFLSGTGTPG